MRTQRLTGQDFQMRGMRQRLAQEVHIDAPIGGWNTRDSIDNMEPTDAVVLDNWIPDLGYVKSRPGYELYVDIAGSDDVKTLVIYEKGATKKFLAFHGTSCTDITNPAAPSTVSAITSGNARWNYAQFDGKLVVVNGVDSPYMYDGSGWAVPNNIFGTFPLSVDGSTDPVVLATLAGVNVFKNRTWFWKATSQDVWYSALNTMGGALTKFPLSRVGQFGGNLIAMQTWTRDGGSGPDDFAVFIMSSGEAIIYQGSSPATGGDWAIVGVYRIGALLDKRAAVKFGPDLFMVTDLDYVNLSEVLAGMEAKTTRTKANGALQQELASNRDQTGWEAIAWPEGRLIIFNIPQGSGTYRQHVFNYVTGAWCRFTGINAHTWCVYDNELYFGGANGCVYKMTTSAKTDEIGTDLTSASYTWTASGHGTNEYHLKTASGGDLGFNPAPTKVYMDGVKLTAGTIGSLADHEWVWGDNDTLGYSTVYVRDNSGDPDTSGVTIMAGVLSPIQTIMQPAWTTLGLTQRKTFVGTRQFLQTNSPINVKNIYEVDFKPFRDQQTPLAVDPEGTPWGSPWGSPWTATDKTLADWEVIQGYGTVGGMKQYLNLKQAVKFLGMTWLYKIGERL